MDTTINVETGPARAAAQFNNALTQMADSQRALLQEISQYAKDEAQRFLNLRLERNGAALDKLQNCHGISGLIGAQQEWLRDLLQDYAGQQLRVAGALRGLAQNAMATAGELASENIARMQQEASDIAHQAEAQVKEQVDTINHAMDNQGMTGQPVNEGQSGFVSETQHYQH